VTWKQSERMSGIQNEGLVICHSAQIMHHQPKLHARKRHRNNVTRCTTNMRNFCVIFVVLKDIVSRRTVHRHSQNFGLGYKISVIMVDYRKLTFSANLVTVTVVNVNASICIAHRQWTSRNAPSALVPCKQKCVSRRLKAASVSFRSCRVAGMTCSDLGV